MQIVNQQICHGFLFKIKAIINRHYLIFYANILKFPTPYTNLTISFTVNENQTISKKPP